MSGGTGAMRGRFFLLPLETGHQDGEDWSCLFTLTQVVEVVGRSTKVYPVPFSPACLPGYILRWDTVIPVVDVERLCGWVKASNVRMRQMLVIRTGQSAAAGGEFARLAIACTGNVSTFTLGEREAGLPVESLEAPEGFDGHGLARGFFRLHGRRVVLMDFDALARGLVHIPAGQRMRGGSPPVRGVSAE